MEHVELLRVHTSGTDLVLRTPAGEEYLLALDEALRRSVRMPQPRAASQAAVPATTVPLSPRQIQARIRAGESAAQVAAESGTDLDHVLRYEGPVLAERNYIASRARDVEVSGPLSNEGYRAAFGDESATLGDMVHTRLRSFGVEPETLTWDAWKLDSGTWRIVARFTLPDSAADLGEQPPAEWTFHPGRKHLENANRWAQVLSEWEPWDVLPSQRRLVPVAPHPESEDSTPDPVPALPPQERPEATSAPSASGPSASGPSAAEPEDDLLEVLSRRRGTRSGEEPEDDAALARILDRTRHESDESAPTDSDEPHETRADGREEPEPHPSAWPPLRRVPDPIPATTETDESKNAKKRRSQVPSWDEIVFGRSARGEDDDAED
ncbi:MAG: septation protein SepH [Galactobacter sp.]